MTKYFVFVILLFSFPTFAGEIKLKAELEYKNNNFRIYIINYGDDVLINTRFSLKKYPSFPSGVQFEYVDFEIVNKEGEKFPFGAVHIDEAGFGEQDIVLLKYRGIIGYEFHISNLISCYNLIAGIYKARLTYENTRWADKGVYIGRLTSNWITFEVPEKKEDIK